MLHQTTHTHTHTHTWIHFKDTITFISTEYMWVHAHSVYRQEWVENWMNEQCIMCVWIVADVKHEERRWGKCRRRLASAWRLNKAHNNLVTSHLMHKQTQHMDRRKGATTFTGLSRYHVWHKPKFAWQCCGALADWENRRFPGNGKCIEVNLVEWGDQSYFRDKY